MGDFKGINIFANFIFLRLGSDFVRIRDGFSMSSPLIFEFSGTASNLNSLSNGNQVYFGFAANSGVQQRGFNATWREI